MPIYTACIMLGALSPDHTDVRMTFKDQMRYNPDEMLRAMSALGRRKRS